MPRSGWRDWRRLARNEQVILSVLTGLVGAAAAGGVITFRELLGLVQLVFFGFASERVHSLAAELAWWHVLLAPAVGGLLIGLYLHFLMPGRRAQGVAEVVAAGHRGGHMPLGQGLAAAGVSAASLGVGASAGREGPMVHLGGTLASFVAARAGLGSAHRLTLLGCGVAAGVAASFNAPIAGVFFALEVVIGHYALSVFSPVVIAAVIGTVVSRMYFGDFPAFIVPDYRIASVFEFPAFVLLGLVAAVVAIAFMRCVFLAQDMTEKSPVPAWARPAAAGLAVGVIAIVFPQVLGVGYEATDAALQELFPLWLLLALIVAKTAATAITLGAGFGGGVFSPSIFLGAMTGGAFGIIAAQPFPELASNQGLYALIGMGAVAAPVLGAPISTILILFELTGDYSLTIAAMIAVAVSSIATRQVVGHSFFTWQLERQGINLRGGRALHSLRTLKVVELMTDAYRTVPHDTPLRAIRELFSEAPNASFFVTDQHNRLTGVLSLAELVKGTLDSSLDPDTTAQDLAQEAPEVLTARHSLERAHDIMERERADTLPVVDDPEMRTVIGVLDHKDVLRAYNQALREVHAEEHDEAR